MSKITVPLPLKVIADLLGVSTQTIRNRGYKISKKAKGQSFYDAREIVRDHIKLVSINKTHEESDSEKLRLIKAQAEKAELRNAQLRADLIQVSDAIEVWDNHIHPAKTKIRGLAKTLSMIISDENSPQKNAQIILEHIDKALKEVELDTREYKKAALRRSGGSMASGVESKSK